MKAIAAQKDWNGGWTVKAGATHVRSGLIQDQFAWSQIQGQDFLRSTEQRNSDGRFLSCTFVVFMALSSQSGLGLCAMGFYFKLTKHGFLCVWEEMAILRTLQASNVSSQIRDRHWGTVACGLTLDLESKELSRGHEKSQHYHDQLDTEVSLWLRWRLQSPTMYLASSHSLCFLLSINILDIAHWAYVPCTSSVKMIAAWMTSFNLNTHLEGAILTSIMLLRTLRLTYIQQLGCRPIIINVRVKVHL